MLPRLARFGIVAFIGLFCFYVVLWIFSIMEVAYKTNIEYPVVENVAESAVTAYLDGEGYQDIKQITCGVDKMEECLVTVLFFDDPLVYTYCYNLEKQGIELLWISDITNCTGVPKHFPKYDEMEEGYILYYYGIDDYLLDNESTKWDAYVNTKIFNRAVARKV